jgi:hypothetical protein
VDQNFINPQNDAAFMGAFHPGGGMQHAHVLHRCVAHLGMLYSSPTPQKEMHPL